MIILQRRRGELYVGPGPLTLTDPDSGDVSYPTEAGRPLIGALNQVIFDPLLVDGEDICLDGQVVARMSNGLIVAA